MFFAHGGRAAAAAFVRVGTVIRLSPSQSREPWRVPLDDKDVGRLDVAMNDALRMGRIERIGDLNCELDSTSRVSMASPRSVPQRHPFQKLHHDEGLVHRVCRFRKSCRCWDD